MNYNYSTEWQTIVFAISFPTKLWLNDWDYLLILYIEQINPPASITSIIFLVAFLQQCIVFLHFGVKLF